MNNKKIDKEVIAAAQVGAAKESTVVKEEANEAKGGNNNMSNIRKNLNAAKAKKLEAEKAAKRAAELAAITPKDVVDTMDEVTSGYAHSAYREDGRFLGINGNAGAYIQDYVFMDNGEVIPVAAKTQEELNTIKENIKLGMTGDGKFHKRIYIEGYPCDCAGGTLEELEDDMRRAEEYMMAHRKGSLKDVVVSEKLVKDKFKKEDLEEVSHNGNRYLINYESNLIMTFDGEPVVDLDDIKSKLCKEDVRKLLVERLNSLAQDAEDTEDCEDYEEDDYEDEDEDCDDRDLISLDKEDFNILEEITDSYTAEEGSGYITSNSCKVATAAEVLKKHYKKVVIKHDDRYYWIEFERLIDED